MKMKSYRIWPGERPAYPTVTMPVIALVHIRPATFAAMKGRFRDRLEPIAFYGEGVGEEGVMVLGGEINPDDRIELPPDLVQVIDWAKAEGYDWFRLDDQAALIDGLPNYEDEWE